MIPGHLCMVKSNDLLLPKHCRLTGSHTSNSCQLQMIVNQSRTQPLLYSKRSSGTFDREEPHSSLGHMETAILLSHPLLLLPDPTVTASCLHMNSAFRTLSSFTVPELGAEWTGVRVTVRGGNNHILCNYMGPRPCPSPPFSRPRKGNHLPCWIHGYHP